MVSAAFCISSAAACGSSDPVVSFSSVSFIAAETSLHVAIAGCAFVFFSCSPNFATFSSPLSFVSSHAAWTAGRSVTCSYHATCVFGSDRWSTNFQASISNSLS
jgi:hypothetical protein